MKIVATTSLPAVDRPNADRWNAARSRQHILILSELGLAQLQLVLFSKCHCKCIVNKFESFLTIFGQNLHRVAQNNFPECPFTGSKKIGTTFSENRIGFFELENSGGVFLDYV